MTASRNVRQGMFLSIGGDQVNEAESEIQLDRMRRSSNVVDMQDALQSVQKRRELKAVVIQKSWRKHKLEKVRRQKDNAARCIQKYFRLHAQKTKELLTSKAVMIQRAWKRYTLRANKHLPLAASTIEQSQAPRNAEEEKKEREGGDDNGSKRTLAASGDTNMAELTPEDAVLDYGPAPSFASKASEDDLNGSHSRLTPGESSSSAEFMIDGVITKVSPELLEIESALFEDVLEGALEDLAKELNVEDMFHQWNVQWNMIQRMFRKKGLVPAIDWLFTYFTRGEAYFWLDILQTHLFPELKMSFKWPDTYGGGFVFSSAGWINAAPLQAARRPERPKPKRGKTDITKLTSMNKGKQGFDLNITSFATQARSQAGNNGRPNESAGTDGHQNHQNATALNENDSQAEPTKTNGMTTPFDSSLASHFTSDEYDEDLEEIGRLVSPFTPSFISSDSPSKTGGFNTHATRPSSVPKASPNGNRPATATSLASTSSGIRLHIAGRTTRPSSRMTTPQQSPLQRGSRTQRSQTASASNSRDFGGKGNLHPHPHPHPHPRNHLTTPRTMTPVHYSRTEEESGGEGEGEGRRRSLRDVDYDRLSLHSAPSLPRSLERRPSPKLRPKWKGHFSDIPPNQLKFLPIEYGGLGPTSRTTSRAMLLEEKRKREKLYKTVNSLNELQLNITNELIDSVIKPDSGW